MCFIIIIVHNSSLYKHAIFNRLLNTADPVTYQAGYHCNSSFPFIIIDEWRNTACHIIWGWCANYKVVCKLVGGIYYRHMWMPQTRYNQYLETFPSSLYQILVNQTMKLISHIASSSCSTKIISSLLKCSRNVFFTTFDILIKVFRINVFLHHVRHINHEPKAEVFYQRSVQFGQDDLQNVI